MAVTQNTYTGNGSTVLYSFTFPYLEASDIKVTLNGTLTTAYTLANATTIQFNTAPTNGAAIVIYRDTANTALVAEFYPGSAIRAQDLNNDLTQGLYIAQESRNTADSAKSASTSATATANTALSQSSAAVNTANTASANASSAVTTANTASTNASAAVSTANTASSNASTAVTTANSAVTTANTKGDAAIASAATANTTAASAVTTANAATSTANTASTNAASAVSTANTASSNASAAVSTANTASANAATAVTTANSAVSTANAATTTATNANSKADQAIAAVASSINYTLVANVAAIPATPANNTYIEISNSTGLQSFTPLVGLPGGFVGDAGLTVRLVYQTSNTSWNWLTYFANNSETRYLKLAGGTLTGGLTLAGAPSSGLQATTKTYVDAADATLTTAAAAAQTTANAAVVRAGDTMTGALGITAGTAAAPSLFVSGSTNTGLYSPSTGAVAISSSGSQRLTIDASGRLLAGASASSSVNRAVFQGNSALGTGTAIVQLSLGNSSPASGDQLGRFQFTDSNHESSAEIIAARDGGTWNTSTSRPTRLVLSTTADGTSSPTERLRITSGGLVGVGVSAPETLLDLRSATPSLHIAPVNQTAPDLRGYTVDFSRNAQTGGVNFTAVSPSAFLDLYSGGSATAGGGWDGQIRFFTGGSNSYGTERVRIDASGRVGIGTSSPGALLTIFGSTGATHGVQMNANGWGYVNRIGVNGTSGDELIISQNWNAATNTVDSSSFGTTFIRGNTSNGSLAFGTGPANTVPTTRLFINNVGAVGIGTTSPSYALHVVSNTTQALFEGATQGNINIQKVGTNGFGIYSDAAGTLNFYDNNSSSLRLKLDSSGRLLVGTSSTSSEATLILQGYNGGAGYAVARLCTTSATPVNDQVLGYIVFGDSTHSNGAWINAQRDGGTWSGSSKPTRLGFSTTADGASSPTERFRISSTGAQSSVIPGGSTLYPSFDCRAWVNFNGTGTVAIRGSGNVSSITDNGTGDYTVNFTTAMVDANFSVGQTSQPNTSDNLSINNLSSISASQCRVVYMIPNVGARDVLHACVQIFR